MNLLFSRYLFGHVTRKGYKKLRPHLLLFMAAGLGLVPLPFASNARGAEPPRLYREPTLSQEAVVFVFGGDLWTVPRGGGTAVRLTTHPGEERFPKFSPDGRQIAFSASYDGNVDVYVMPAEGGVPVRLTSHPADDSVRGWTPDGRRVLFASLRHSPNDSSRLFTVPVEGGPAAEVPLPMAEDGSYSPDGTRLAYVPVFQWQAAWKRYRGGQTRPIWIAQVSDSSVEKVPRENSQDFNPMWVGKEIYFLSDRSGPVTLFAFDTQSRQVRSVLPSAGLDFKSASAGPGGIVFEQFGKLGLFDPATGLARFLEIRTVGDFAEVRPRFNTWEKRIPTVGRLSPTGQRGLFESRGEIITVPADKGDVRNLTRTPGIAERDPAWSPDGRFIAYFSEEGGEYGLQIRAHDGTGQPRRIALGSPASFYYAPKWSPDGNHLAYVDKSGVFRLVTVTNSAPVPVEIDGEQRGSSHLFSYNDNTVLTWSPDSRWIAYVRALPNATRAIFVYSLEERRSWPVTDGLADAVMPVFADSGKYLYFAVSTDSGPSRGSTDLSILNRPVTRSLYLVVLDRTLTSPLASESDEEKPASAGVDSKDQTGTSSRTETNSVTALPSGTSASGSTSATNTLRVKIDFEGINQRILALPLPPKNYTLLAAGKSNVLFATEAPLATPIEQEEPSFLSVLRFDLATRKSETFLEGIVDFQISANREKVLYRRDKGPSDRSWFIAGAETSPKAGEGQLKFGNTPIWIDPRLEWRQMFEEAWRIERDFFYDPGLHGLDLPKVKARYAPYVEGLVSRADLNYLFEEMLGELSVGHMFIAGGDSPEPPRVSVGLLGADFRVENGRYRIDRIYDGENWNPKLRAPLTEPGVNASVGDYLLAVDGVELNATREVYLPFQNKAGRIVSLRLGANPDGTGSREVTVTPIADEKGLRHRAWVEDNRRTVARLSQGRLGYVHLPDTMNGGFASFTRYYFAQQDKQGFVIDERYNHGGLLDDYFVDYLSRPITSWAVGRDGKEFSIPFGANPGPKVLLINEFAGSGGDAFPWYFRKAKIGPLVGKRTWGGLVGIGNYPQLLDGGMITAPHVAIFGTSGSWEVENVGIAPDVEVELDPKGWREGRDTQLEKAVEIALERLQQNPIRPSNKPKYPVYHSERP